MVGSHGVPSPKFQVPLMLASPNIKAESQLLSIKKPLKYTSLSLKVDLSYCQNNYSLLDFFNIF